MLCLLEKDAESNIWSGSAMAWKLSWQTGDSHRQAQFSLRWTENNSSDAYKLADSQPFPVKKFCYRWSLHMESMLCIQIEMWHGSLTWADLWEQ